MFLTVLCLYCFLFFPVFLILIQSPFFVPPAFCPF
jgi:hypothetical protein